MASNKKAPQGEPLGTNLQDNNITTKDGRARNFACVVYPESAPENWLQIIAEAKIPVLVSPLHNRDKNPTGEEKKHHHHVIAMYDGKKTEEQVRQFFESFGGVGCEQVQVIRGYARYLCHLDNPEKAQYDTADVLQYGGADYLSIIELPTDRLAVIREMQAWLRANEVVSYAALMDYAADEKPDWFKVLCESASYVMDKYLKSLKWELDLKVFDLQQKRIQELEIQLNNINPETGELVDPQGDEAGNGARSETSTSRQGDEGGKQ